MFDFDAGKLLIIGVVALIVIGPKELPRVLRQVGQMVGRVRRMATEFQGQFMDAMKEADIESIRQDLEKVAAEAELDGHFDPARDIQRELTASLDRPEAAEAVPAFADVPAVPTDGFMLPRPADITPEPAAPLAIAVAPVAPDDVEVATAASGLDPLAHVNGSAVLPAAKKRKIRLPKRGGLPVRRVHAVTDRAALARARGGAGRVRETAGP